MFEDVTFVTHLRVDHPDRLQNLQTVLSYYSSNFPGSSFVIVQDGSSPDDRVSAITLPPKTKGLLMKNDSPHYHRTKALNIGIKNSDTELVVSLDTDCIVGKKQFEECVSRLKIDATIAWPYNGTFIDVRGSTKARFCDTLDFDCLLSSFAEMGQMALGTTQGDFGVRGTKTVHINVGGIVMFNKTRFVEAGMYNEHFVSWGAEDNELDWRTKILEHVQFRPMDDESICFHLAHRQAVRNINPFYNRNADEATAISHMSKETLTNYMKDWEWLK